MTVPAVGGSPLIEIAALRARLGEPALRIVDARFDLAAPGAGWSAFAESRIPGAVYAHLDEDLSDHHQPASAGRHPLPSAARLAACFAAWGITPATPVVIYDAGSGAMAAARLWWLLRWMGHPEVRVLDGGWAAWQAASAVIDTALTMPASRKSWGTPDAADPRLAGWSPGAARTWTADAVAARRADHVLIDARAPERYRGEVEPLDPQAGHIPGARNRPFCDNLEHGRFKPREALRAEWSLLLPPGTTPVLYCGSGVTACHNALALVQAGWPLPVLFAPSWSGWVSEPSRPVAIGPEAGTPGRMPG